MKSIKFLKPTRLDDLIRIGRNYDGGYLVNSRVVGQTKALIGLGIDRDWSFEEQFQSLNPNVSIWCFDGSVSGTGTKADRFRIFMTQKIPMVYQAIVSHGIHIRLKVFTIMHIIKVYKDVNRLFPQFKLFFSKPNNKFFSLFVSSQKKSNHISPSEVLEKISKMHPLTPNSCFLKMDIEGHEFSTLPEFLIHSNFINSMVIEFHDLDFRWDSFLKLVEQIKEQFVISHVHGNNNGGLFGNNIPKTLEITFLNKSLFKEDEDVILSEKYPIANLDYPCNLSVSDYELVFS